MTTKLKSLKLSSDECVVLETALDYSQYVGAGAVLNRRDKMRFTARKNGVAGQILVWRIK